MWEKSPYMEYPLYTSGKRNCPPKDCGGVQGYFYLL